MTGVARSSLMSKETWQQVDGYAQIFEKAWREAALPDAPSIDAFLPEDDRLRLLVLKELIHVDMQRRRMINKPIPDEDYLQRYPELAAMFTKTAARPEPPAVAEPTSLPDYIGGYRVLRFLGQGTFGIVYLAQDEQLSRPVAVKVPRRDLVARPQDAEAYLAEARTVAGLDHPNIVPVYHSGSTAVHPFFIVSKFIEGGTLAQQIKEKPPTVVEAAKLVRKIAETLHYAHRKGLVHRDIKPGNILLERGARDDNPPVPYVADFGLALREENIGQGPRFAGTPAYMSPEQARGEGHRVDGRSDIFSLGVVFYELLTGRRPFHGLTQDELLQQITSMDARPPRQLADTPKELERICLKCLAKLASERYLTADDLAGDLAHFLDSAKEIPRTAGQEAERAFPAPTPLAAPNTSFPLPPSESRSITIVPKGLRSFDAHDADFFLELVPGPRGREGLPEGIRFWKTKIEERDVDNTFTDNTFVVGLIYGPSGCGKSSLVKAGLLPRLHSDVIAVYVEATAEQTETRLLNGLRKRCPALPANLNLKEALTALRRGQGAAAGKKVLIVLDQFEQWLHGSADRDDSGAELVEALRQCDGCRVQCIIMVRDDFWLAVSRFLKKLEVRLLEGQNSALVDLFDMEHAKNVLAALGRAYGKLPESSAQTTKVQFQFLDQAVSDLAQDGKVICVRVALFAEMMKGKTWTPATLKAVGGSTGVGVTFLEETFSASTAPPQHRYHQHAARSVLKALAPEAGTDIKGHMKSYHELLAASGYENRPQDFDDLIHILDSEVRLITPTDPEGVDDSALRIRSGDKHYQLTHDYLVHSVREWLARKQKESRRGRAELRLAERGELWRAKPERRQLASLREWLSIRLLTNPRGWTDCQRQMMRSAAVKHLISVTGVLALGMVVACVALFYREHLAEERAASQAESLVRRLLDAKVSETPAIIDELADYRRWADPILQKELADPNARRDHQLHARLALVLVDQRHVSALREALLEADVNEFPFIRNALVPYSADLVDGFWDMAESGGGVPERRFRAAAALASYDPAGVRWQGVTRFVAERLVAQPSLVLPQWVETMQPIKDWLLPALEAIFRERSTQPGASAVVAEVIGAYAFDRPELMASALAFAPADSFAILFSRLQGNGPKAEPALRAVLDQTPPPEGAEADQAASQRANLALALLRLGSGDRLWPLLKASDNPRVRSFAIDRFASLECPPASLLEHLEKEADDTIRAALWLGLGGFDDKALPQMRRAQLRPTLLAAHRDDPSAAVHAAVRWLLDKWGMPSVLPPGTPRGDKKWYVNSMGQTMVRIAGPVSFMMGSLPSERGHVKQTETYHRAQIDHSFDIGMTEVTIGQFCVFLKQRKGHDNSSHYALRSDNDFTKPVVEVSWYEAVEFCNWLSEKEGLGPDQWCYEPNEKGNYANGMKILPRNPRRTGYRLPTEPEWEYACRGGADTSRCYGDADSLLSQYAVYARYGDEKYAPVAKLLPNAFGIFDMHGNASEWCEDQHKLYPSAPVAATYVETILNDNYRSARGGGITSPTIRVRSAIRFSARPSHLESWCGFRVTSTAP